MIRIWYTDSLVFITSHYARTGFGHTVRLQPAFSFAFHLEDYTIRRWLLQVHGVAQHTAQHTGDGDSPLWRYWVGVEESMSSSESWVKWCIHSLLHGRQLYPMVPPCPFAQKWWLKVSTISCFQWRLICFDPHHSENDCVHYRALSDVQTRYHTIVMYL